MECMPTPVSQLATCMLQSVLPMHARTLLARRAAAVASSPGLNPWMLAYRESTLVKHLWIKSMLICWWSPPPCRPDPPKPLAPIDPRDPRPDIGVANARIGAGDTPRLPTCGGDAAAAPARLPGEAAPSRREDCAYACIVWLARGGLEQPACTRRGSPVYGRVVCFGLHALTVFKQLSKYHKQLPPRRKCSALGIN